MVILNLYGIPVQAVVVFRLEHDFLFKSASSYFESKDFGPVLDRFGRIEGQGISLS